MGNTSVVNSEGSVPGTAGPSERGPVDIRVDIPERAEKQYGVLKRSVDDFNRATVRMQEAFGHLEKKFEDINRELEKKNAELERIVTEKEDVKNYLVNILESLTTGVIVTDLEGNITTLNRCAGIYFGLYPELVLGKPIHFFLADIAPVDGGVLGGEAGTGKIGQKIRLKDRIIEVFGSPMKATDGSTTGRVLILRDVTRVEKLEEMAKRTEKLAAMGELAANIAHEIRNPLGSIELFASLMMKNSREKRDRERLAQVLEAVRSMDNKISNLLLFTRKKNPLMRKMALHGLLKEVIGFSEQIIGQKGIGLSARYDVKDPTILGDAEMLKQVFLNVIINAIQAMPGGGHLEIETAVSGSGVDSSVEVRVSDTGIGIPEEHIKKIFDPFFSNWQECSSTGLGLAIVHSIVDTHHGSIDVESSSRGAVVKIAFPVVEEQGEGKSSAGGER